MISLAFLIFNSFVSLIKKYKIIIINLFLFIKSRLTKIKKQVFTYLLAHTKTPPGERERNKFEFLIFGKFYN